MLDWSAISAIHRSESSEAEPGAPVSACRCRRCQLDLGGQNALARFCPRCGYAVVPAAEAPAHGAPPGPAARAQSVDAATLRLSHWLRQSAERRTAAAPADAAAPSSLPAPAAAGPGAAHSLMLLGYSNAMYRLGWRYETGSGTVRNPDEAVRCYFKAARLGNPAALRRLTPAADNKKPMTPPPAPPARRPS